MDELTDLYDDGYYPEDTPAGDDGYKSVEDGSGDSDGNPSIADILKDILDGYFSSDETDEEANEETGEEIEEGIETDTDTEQGTDETENVDGYLVDPEILSEINDTLHQHTDDVEGFISGVTFSGNAVIVSFDDASSALLTETLQKQDEIMERMDHMSGLVVMVLFVLSFDILHRFAKRIVKNLTRGDDNKNAADS